MHRKLFCHRWTLHSAAVCVLYSSLLNVVGGKGCTAYDVIINPTLFESINSRELLMGFFLTVVLEGLEAKYDMTLDRRTYSCILMVDIAHFVDFQLRRLCFVFEKCFIFVGKFLSVLFLLVVSMWSFWPVQISVPTTDLCINT